MVATENGVYRHTYSTGGIRQHQDAALAKKSLRDAEEHVDGWFSRPGDACFHSLVFSAKLSDYSAAVQRIRQQFLEEAARLDSDCGDMVVTFNMQLIPTYKHRGGGN